MTHCSSQLHKASYSTQWSRWVHSQDTCTHNPPNCRRLLCCIHALMLRISWKPPGTVDFKHVRGSPLTCAVAFISRTFWNHTSTAGIEKKSKSPESIQSQARHIRHVTYTWKKGDRKLWRAAQVTQCGVGQIACNAYTYSKTQLENVALCMYPWLIPGSTVLVSQIPVSWLRRLVNNNTALG